MTIPFMHLLGLITALMAIMMNQKENSMGFISWITFGLFMLSTLFILFALLAGPPSNTHHFSKQSAYLIDNK